MNDRHETPDEARRRGLEQLDHHSSHPTTEKTTVTGEHPKPAYQPSPSDHHDGGENLPILKK